MTLNWLPQRLRAGLRSAAVPERTRPRAAGGSFEDPGAAAVGAGILPGEILRQVRRLEIRTRAVVSEVFAGQYHSVFKGRGMEFAEVREYVPGDDIRTIDWNVTARYGTPFVKKHVEERELTVFLAVDASASQNFGSAGRSKVELAAEIGALLAFSAINNHDKVGLLTFTDHPEIFIPPRKGRAHGLRLIREILYRRPAGRGTDIAGACEHIVHALKRRSVVFLVSDFLTEAVALERPLGTLARKHDLIAIEIRDPLEDVGAPVAGGRPVPAAEAAGAGWPRIGLIEWEDPESGERFLIDTADRVVRERLARAGAARQESLHAMLARQGVDLVTLRVGHDPVEPLLAFFHLRARRLARE
ncbi:MAG: DUF58 domain-containing protein [Candidatus Eisenbacteria bacterium]